MFQILIREHSKSTYLNQRQVHPTPEMLVASTKMMWDSDHDFWIGQYPGVDQIAATMWWIHFLVGLSHFAKLCESCRRQYEKG